MPDPIDNRADVAVIQKRVCGAPTVVRARHGNPDLGVHRGDLLTFTRDGDGGAFRATGLIRQFGAGEARAFEAAYGGALLDLYGGGINPPSPDDGAPTAA